ncbi:MAG: hypothetical protein A3I61_19800 [Acidobacteria bacterium RIFCSPLOWO2_02_FULL_68_18]|nr:MAG: hypothetical protein A3I61_19800 [Acidobacteria bacterium RIFCSPLOWO2_02_FULL_68_18]OFW48342.1 MAG: hypothetical protein A3G77_03335 [Acidobacteria bacterium RIFCSPLOWO2_12_FULL_68_19]
MLRENLKAIYSALPWKRQLFSLVRRVCVPPPGIYRHLHFKGPFDVQVDGTAFQVYHHGWLIENEIFWKGIRAGWEGTSLSLWIELCKHADVICDVGANTGIYALTAQAVQPSARVYAFEPARRVFEMLEQNCTLNHYRAACLNVAVSNKDGTAMLFDAPLPHELVATLQPDGPCAEELTVREVVPTIRLDTFAATHGISCIDLIKIDTEGHEFEVIAGLGEWLRMRPSMLIEIQSDALGARIESLLPSGYLYFNIDERAGVRHVQHILKSDTYNHLVCTPTAADRLGLH